MTFKELQQQVNEYMYTEDAGMIRVPLASILATRMQIGNPIWMVLIGPSSSGKSQVLRPLAMTDEKFIHRVDDLTESTLLSGTKVKKGEPEVSLLHRIGKLGILVISDFTVIFSRNSESRNAILSQFRMVYDGEMIKYVGTKSEPVRWEGAIGVIAGSTPSIYGHFEEVADMGERFIYYRMKDYDMEKATRLSLGRSSYGKELDNKLSNLYAEYVEEAFKRAFSERESIPLVSDSVSERILEIAMFAAQLRTPIAYDKYAKVVTKIPVTEGPMRVAQQLLSIARGLMIMRFHDSDGTSWELDEEDIAHVEWCAYSLANEEKRVCLNILAQVSYGDYVRTQTVADKIGLNTSVIGITLQNLGAIGVLERSGDNTGLSWRIKDTRVWSIVRRLNGITDESSMVFEDRDVSIEELGVEDAFDAMF